MSEFAIITGGTKGLGRALVEKWLAEGWSVATCARNPKEIAELRQLLSSDKLLAEVLDIANENAVTHFVHSAFERFGTPQVLINNAGVLGPRVDLVDYPADEWRKVIDANLNGAFYMTRAALPYMIAAREGVILNISSSAGIEGKARWGAYAASKFAIEGFSQVLRNEVFDHKIRVHAVDPGRMQTDMRRAAYPEEDITKHATPDVVARVMFDIAVVYEPQLLRLEAVSYM